MAKYYKNSNREGLLTDETVHVCESCNRCWEITKIKSSGVKTSGYLFYADFPTYGKKRKTCGQCKGSDLKLKKTYGMLFYEIQNNA